MSTLVIPSIIVALLFLILTLAFICAVYKAKTDELLRELKLSEAEIKSWKDYVAEKKERKLYTFKSGTDLLENVVSWKEVNQHLRLTLDDGSICVVGTPSRYKLLIQDQSEQAEDTYSAVMRRTADENILQFVDHPVSTPSPEDLTGLPRFKDSEKA